MTAVSIGTPDECNHLDKADEPTVAIEEAEIGSADGHYRIFYTSFLGPSSGRTTRDLLQT